MAKGLTHGLQDIRKGRTAAIGMHGYYCFYGEIISNRKGVVELYDTSNEEIRYLATDEICTVWTDNCDSSLLRDFKYHWDKWECNANW